MNQSGALVLVIEAYLRSRERGEHKASKRESQLADLQLLPFSARSAQQEGRCQNRSGFDLLNFQQKAKGGGKINELRRVLAAGPER